MSKEHKAPALEIHSPGLHGSGTSTGTYYKIEFRNTSSMPIVIGDGRRPFPFVIDNYWRALPVCRGATEWGVNIPIRAWDGDAADHGLLSYVAAEAHRWAFLAALEAGVAGAGGALCVETRLVAVELHRQHSTKEVGVTEAQSFAFKPPTIKARASIEGEPADAAA